MTLPLVQAILNPHITQGVGIKGIHEIESSLKTQFRSSLSARMLAYSSNQIRLSRKHFAIHSAPWLMVCLSGLQPVEGLEARLLKDELNAIDITIMGQTGVGLMDGRFDRSLRSGALLRIVAFLNLISGLSFIARVFSKNYSLGSWG